MKSLATACGVLALGVSFLSGCAHVKSTKDGNGPSSVAEVIQQDGSPTGRAQGSSTKMTQLGDITVMGVKLQNTQFDYPIAINSRVEYWINYFTGRGRKHFARYLERSELFIPYITPILRQNGMPEDLVYLAMIESGFNNHARSHAKAVGPWQFISATGKRYGLMVNWWVDERRDTRKSTLAAVEYLRDLYNMFQSWELAAAAYNAGEAKVARAIRRYGTKDFWALTRHRFFRPETRDYVPKIMAAAIIAKNRTQFGFAASTIHPGKDEAIAGDGELVKLEGEKDATAPNRGESISNVLKADLKADYDDYEDAPEELMNASLTGAAGVQTLLAEGGASNVEPQPLAKPVPTPHVSKKGDLSGEELTEFEVQSPADLLKVARAAGLSYQTVKSLNPELLRWCTPPTVGSYRIKLPTSIKDQFLTTYNHTAYPRKVQFLAYKVRQGETLSKIAGHFGIKVDPIADLNGVSPRVSLRKGSRVFLPMPNDRSRTLASLEVRDPPEKRKFRGNRRGKKNLYKVTYKRREGARYRGNREPNES